MIPPSVIREIERLLQEGQHTRRKIAQALGVARSTVTAVARGQRRVDDYLRHVPRTRPKALGTPRRCPGCDAVVHMPCKLCQTRELMIGNTLPPINTVVDTPVGLNLKPEHQARYAEVRRWRRQAFQRDRITRTRSDSDTPYQGLHIQ